MKTRKRSGSMAIYIADTYAWYSYFEGGGCREFIEGNEIETPSLVLAELTRVLLRKKIPAPLLERIQRFIQKNSLILPLDASSALKAGETAIREKLPLIDAIIYSYAGPEKPLLTGDEHFRGKPNVKFFK